MCTYVYAELEANVSLNEEESKKYNVRVSGSINSLWHLAYRKGDQKSDCFSFREQTKYRTVLFSLSEKYFKYPNLNLL